MIKMKKEFPFLWDDVHKYFPKEEIAKLRKKLMEEHRTGKYSDKELMERYHMSKQTFYDTLEKFKEAAELLDFMDESKAPKNHYRKLLPEHEEKIKELVKTDRDELKQKQQQFENKMENSGKKIRKQKLEKLKNEMKHSLKGCRKIANEFNRQICEKGKDISIGKTIVHKKMREMGMYVREEDKRFGGHLMRPPEPFIEFSMDFTEKVIAGGDRAYIFNLLDKFDNEKIILDAHKKQDADAVIRSLKKFRKSVDKRGVIITSDNGKEFKNQDVLDYCSKHRIFLDFVNKGKPWENAFIERDMRTLHEECLNLIWIDNVSEIQPLLDEFKQKANCRPNMSFGYMSPLEKLEDFFNRKKRENFEKEMGYLKFIGV
jgi:transposase InsO family protein